MKELSEIITLSASQSKIPSACLNAFNENQETTRTKKKKLVEAEAAEPSVPPADMG